MALQKQPVNINFSQGLDTKTDPYQVDIGKFLVLNNMVFDTAKRLTKRNGFANITSLPNTEQTTLTTFNDNLLATGSNLLAYSQDTNQWYDKGLIQPVALSVQSMVRSSTSQTSPDVAVTALGLTCLSYLDNGQVYYQISDSSTGQQIIPRTALPNGVASPRSYLIGNSFIVTFISTIGGGTHLQYIAIPVMSPSTPSAVFDITTSLTNTLAGYDAYVANDILYIAWADTGNTVKLSSLTPSLVQASPTVIVGHTATLVSVTVDNTGVTPTIWVSFWDSSSTNGFTSAFDQVLAPVLAPIQIITAIVIKELTSVAQNDVLTAIYENSNTYAAPYPTPGVRTDFTSKMTVTVSGVVTPPSVLLRSVGLASKAFIGVTGTIYVLVTYGEDDQPTYFLVDSTGAMYMRLAYTNGGGYLPNQVLPNVSLIDGTYYVAYSIKDFLATVNKGTDLPTGTPVNAIYTQLGINLAKFSINTSGQQSSEIANVLNLTGGQLWMYDGVKPVEQNFHVWPENVAATTATGSGGLVAQDYYYVFTYEWTDNQGNLHRSSPSIPLLVTTSTGTSTNTLYVPTLRLTYKVAPNPVRIVGYRWSVAQQVYYQFTSITSPVVNSTTVDYVTIIDSNSDAAILGQTLLYTTGGVIENIAPPASIDTSLFKNRLWLIDAEDPNLLWYSKQVIENTPVEMSDLLTLYVAPTAGAQGSTGSMKAISAMDDKLIIFKQNAIYYLTGTGPDNTGANNDFTDPVFITASVGCANPDSVVLTPNGIMFQSDKGIWLLGRDLATTYIGAPVEAFNDQVVTSAESIPGTNQVRFILDNNITLVYDYYFQQWGTFSNIRAISATLYQGYHTYLNSLGQVFKETPGSYLDGSKPVLMSITTSWVNVAGLQGYERFYFMYLLGTYLSPFKLNVKIAYDYNPGFSQSTIVTQDNYTPNYGKDAVWGSNVLWGGVGPVFKARVFPSKQKCSAFQITIEEIYDPSFGIVSGAGLTLSGLDLVTGVKKGYRVQKASRSFG